MSKRGWVVLCLMMVGLWQPRAHAVILINEVLADPPSVGGDANGDGAVSTTRDEFIELLNMGAADVSLAGWSLSDEAQIRHLFAPQTLIPGSGFFVVFGGGAPQGFSHVAVASSGGLSLNNTADRVELRDAQAVLMDSLIYGAEGGRDASLTRSPDATGAFIRHSEVSPLAFSPGRTIDGDLRLPTEEETTPGTPPSETHQHSALPEPSSLLLLGAGLMGVVRRRCPM